MSLKRIHKEDLMVEFHRLARLLVIQIFPLLSVIRFILGRYRRKICF